MGDMKDNVKGFMKKVNNPFSSSSSGKFKGQGRVLGSSSSPSPSSSWPANSFPTPTPRPRPSPSQNPNPKPKTTSPIASDHSRTDGARKLVERFDPLDSLVTSSQRSQNGYTLNVYECPICKKPFRFEDEVSEHVDSCLSNPVDRDDDDDDDEKRVSELAGSEVESNNELEVSIGTYVSGKPSEGSVDVVLKLLKNIVKCSSSPSLLRLLPPTLCF